MKANLFAISLAVTVFFCSCGGTSNITSVNYSSNESAITYQQFYDGLSPYGRWVDYPGYGFVWVPNEPEFRPYNSNGHWAYTNYGWTWVSTYNWGWAPFHYGRWFHDNAFGWMWMPGYDWAPAWVSWRTNAECYGWAPLGPRMTINIAVGIPAEHWTFVPHRYINHPQVNNYYIDQQRNTTIINNSTIINNTNVYNTNHNTRNIYQTGPDAKEIEKETNTKINPVVIREINKPGRTELSNNGLMMYKPAVKTVANNDARPATINKVFPPATVDNSKTDKKHDDKPAEVNNERMPPVRHDAVPDPASKKPLEGNPPVKKNDSDPRLNHDVPDPVLKNPGEGNPPVKKNESDPRVNHDVPGPVLKNPGEINRPDKIIQAVPQLKNNNGNGSQVTNPPKTDQVNKPGTPADRQRNAHPDRNKNRSGNVIKPGNNDPKKSTDQQKRVTPVEDKKKEIIKEHNKDN